MKLVNLMTVLCVCIFMIGCASTSKPKVVKIEKRALISDHHLMMSLLNRPMTKDQQIMLAFADQRNRYQENAVFVNAVAILGEKPTDQSNDRPVNSYSNLIARDINSVSVRGPYSF